MITGVCNGCFDLLHEGHLHLLKTAAGMCNRLVVCLNTDTSVRRLKGAGRPIEHWGIRSDSLKATRLVDYIFPFDSDVELALLISELEPDILFKGMDYADKKVIGEQNAKKVFLVDLLPGFSTTAIVERMKR